METGKHKLLYEDTLGPPAPYKYTFLAVIIINLCLRKIYLPPSQEEARAKNWWQFWK
jgi:hypothetical protein